MKKLTLFLGMYCIAWSAFSQNDSINVNAVVILDRMSEVIGQMASCSFHINTSEDKLMPEIGLIKEYSQHQVHFVGPDKMHVQTTNSKNNHGYWYNGDILMYYSLTHNHYGFIDAPDNILETIDHVNLEYGVDFPAADFFYPYFVDNLIEQSHFLSYLGLVRVEGVDCHHIVASGPDQHIQLWIVNDTFTLPVRYVIHEKHEDYTLQFEGVFSDWKINPDLPDAIFDFVVPQTANRLTLVPKSISK
jgi:hypothetical protein